MDAPQGTRLVPIPGAPPSLTALEPGCPFAPRCPLVVDECRAAEPQLSPVAPDHSAACIRTEHVVGRSAADVYGVSTSADTAASGEPPVVVRVRDLVKTFPLTKGVLFRRSVGEVRAVDGISFELRQGRTLGIVGESGSGKSTTLHEILELVAPQSGSIEVLGNDVATLKSASRRALRRDIQVVFQDPAAALDPRLPVFDLLAEPLHANGFSKSDTSARVAELLDTVGLRHSDASRYPAEFSGGQKQRIGIARALALRPKILALDEPVSALDVSIQAGILNLLLDLQQELGLSYLFVSHNLSVVKHLAHQVVVMLRGAIVEQGDSDEIFNRPSTSTPAAVGRCAATGFGSWVARRRCGRETARGGAGHWLVRLLAFALPSACWPAARRPPTTCRPGPPPPSARPATSIRRTRRRCATAATCDWRSPNSRPTSTRCTSTATPPMSAAC